VIIGIKYLKHYPELLLTLPSGLSVYKAKLLSANGNQAVLGGPHAAQAQLISPRLYLTSEARAWYVEQNWVEINSGKLSRLEMFTMEEPESDCKKTAAMAPWEDVTTVIAKRRLVMPPASTQPLRMRKITGRWKTSGPWPPTVASLAGTAPSAGIVRTRRPPASRRRLSRHSSRTAWSSTRSRTLSGRSSRSSKIRPRT
jgi:hypothetical protein